MKINNRVVAILSLFASLFSLGTIILYFFYDFSFNYVIGCLGISQVLGGFNQVNLSAQMGNGKGKFNKSMGIFMLIVGIVLIVGSFII